MLLGDPNRLVVTVRGSESPAQVDWSVLDTMTALQALGEEVVSRQSGEQRFALPFSVYDSIGLLFPALPVYTGSETLFTNDLALLVDFPPLDSTLNPYRPLDAEPALWSDYLHWIVGTAVAVLLLAGALYFFYFAREGPPSVPQVPVVPPHETALAALSTLQQRQDLDDKQYYSELDHILRAYVEARYDVPALERTSAEVTGLLRDQGLPASSELGQLLTQVDLVKFAKAELPPEQRTAALQREEQFVRATALEEPQDPIIDQNSAS